MVVVVVIVTVVLIAWYTGSWSNRRAIGVDQQRVAGRVLQVAQPHAEHHKPCAEEDEEQAQASGHGSVSPPAVADRVDHGGRKGKHDEQETVGCDLGREIIHGRRGLGRSHTPHQVRRGRTR